MDCSQCKIFIGEMRDKEASISIAVMGDEYIYSYFVCKACEMYTAEQYHDHFLGEARVALMAPIPKEEGERIMTLIKACSEPNNKNCTCDSHKALYHGRPSLIAK